MTITVAIESPISDEARVLIDGSEAALREYYKPDECFSFSAEELIADNIHFYVARDNDGAKGCVALVNEGDYGEVKRLYVPKAGRGMGLGKLLMDHLETEAKKMGLPKIMLETGSELKAAVGIYQARGYIVRPRFGDYQDHPASLFMEKTL